MTAAFLILSGAALSAAPAPLPADGPPALPPETVVGTVFGKPVTAADVGLTKRIRPTVEFDSRDRKLWEQMGRITKAFGGPVMKRFVERQKFEATDEEVQKFVRISRERQEQGRRDRVAELEEVKEKLEEPELSAEEREMLEEYRETLESVIESDREMAEAPTTDEVERKMVDFRKQMAEAFILSWKVEQALHEEFGGRVAFQQAGLEALDGRRRLYEQAEDAGEITFADPGVRHLFYYYSNMKHLTAEENVEALKRPWFFREVDEPAAGAAGAADEPAADPAGEPAAAPGEPPPSD